MKTNKIWNRIKEFVVGAAQFIWEVLKETAIVIGIVALINCVFVGECVITSEFVIYTLTLNASMELVVVIIESLYKVATNIRIAKMVRQ